MKKTLFTLTALIFSYTLSVAQENDSKAKEILDQLSKNTKAYESIKAGFTYSLTDQSSDINDSQEGLLITKGDKYFLSLGAQEVMSNGKSMWTHLTDVNEVQVNSVPEDAESAEYVNPNNIFTIYEKGFKYKYEGETTINGKSSDVIELYPKNPKEKSYHTVKLYVDKSRKKINQITIMGKEGTNYTYSIKSFETNVDVPASKFSFDKSKHPDVEVIDLRE